MDQAPLKGVRRRADLVFTRVKVAVFLDGCFWHGCPEHFTVSKTNADYWAAKINTNRLRDQDTDKILSAAGWTVIRIWEHTPTDHAAALVINAVQQQGWRPSP